MQNSQPHMTLYHVDIFLSLGGRIERSEESIMIILFSESLDSFIPPYSVLLAILL